MTQQLAYAEQLLDQDPAEAATRIGGVLTDTPEDVEALCLMARAQLALGRPDLALTAAAGAVTVAPASGYAAYVLSGVLSQLGRHDEAVDAARRSVRFEPYHPHRHDRVAWALLAAGGDLAEADRAARTAIELDPDEPEFGFTFALVASRRGDRQAARRALLDVLIRRPDHAAARHELANLGGGSPAAPGITVQRFLLFTALLLMVTAVGAFRLAFGGHLAAARGATAAGVVLPLLAAGWLILRLDPASRHHLARYVTVGRPLVSLVAAVVSAVLLLGSTVLTGDGQLWLLGAGAAGGLLVRLTVGRNPGDSA